MGMRGAQDALIKDALIEMHANRAAGVPGTPGPARRRQPEANHGDET